MNRTIINKISKYFASQPIEKAWLFGSYARSEEYSKSDIDIMVNFIPEAKVTLFKYVHIVNDLQELTGKRVDLVENGQLKQFAKNSAENDKVLIYERKAQG
jgi:predicted nucleotidyltransferase